MKRFFLFASLLLSALLLGGCHEDIEQRIKALKDDVAALEQRVNSINESIQNLSSLIDALEKNEHITSIKPWSLGDWSGYQIIFTSGTALTLRNGTDGVSPILGVNYNETTEAYYWTIQMGEDGAVTWMTNSIGQRVRATGTVPQLKIEDGVWWYSYDGNSWTKTGWGATQGKSGSSVFSSVDTSDPYYVVFTLASGHVIKIPTQKAVDELNAQCDALNQTMAEYTELVNGIPSSIFVESVTSFEEGQTSGYRLTMEDGQVLTIRNGYDNRDSVLLSAKKYTDGKSYWVFRSRSSEEYQWLRYQGNMICVTLEDITPHIGIVDSVGQLYFTVAVGNGPAEKMRDTEGNAVCATGKIVEDFFTAVDLSNVRQVVLTMADGTKVTLPRTREHIPSVEVSLRNDYVEAETNYTFQILLFMTDTLSTSEALPTYQQYCDSAGMKIEAVCIDDGYAGTIRSVFFSSEPVEGGFKYNLTLDVPFTTGSSSQWYTSFKSRIAIFITWMDKSIMKVVDFRRVIMPTSVNLTADPDTHTLEVGHSLTLTASWLPTNATETNISWSTSDAGIATVANGVVTGVANGECTITARMGRVSTTYSVTVVATP